MYRVWIGLIALCISHIGSPRPLAATEKEWTDRAIGFVAQFEGSSFDAITLDTDCQGLSLGKEQYTIQSNSVRDLFQALVDTLGREGSEQMVRNTRAEHVDELVALMTESLAGNASRLTRVRSWQEMRREGKWVPLTEGECAAGKRRSIGPRDVRLKSGYREMIAAFLQSEPVQAAQEQLIARRGRLALQRSTCWAGAMQRERPTFREFLFFFDYLVQNGDSFTKDGSLQNVAARMQVPNDAKLGNDSQARLKITQLKEWLEADFKHMRRHTRDHGDYAKENAIIWKRLFTEGKVAGDQIKLAYVGLLRAMLGNNEWAYAAMNRRGTIAFGTGIVNGRHLDEMEMQKVLDAGDIDQRALTGTTCP